LVAQDVAEKVRRSLDARGLLDFVPHSASPGGEAVLGERLAGGGQEERLAKSVLSLRFAAAALIPGGVLRAGITFAPYPVALA
jgi:hypothetical protein